MASKTPRVGGNKFNNKQFRKGGKLGPPRIKAFERKRRNKEPETAVIAKLQSQYNSIDPKTVVKFTDFPLSDKTLRGLKENHYVRPTEIQRESIGPCLQGSDVLGAAKTGCGKTLAFLIPVIEKLFCKRWTKGVGALIITPTRELAYQINETLQKVGKYHDFSASLVIGGFDYREELKCIENSNIVISTPGRLLQHIDINPTFFLSDIQVLVLDEADRCLDMGFEKTMNSIIAVLPPIRQTILFSATQTKSVKALARLSLKDPIYVSVHEHSKHSTPEELKQSYMICELEDKVSVLFSFIRNHIKQKSLIFLSCCKQVKYIYEAFCHLRPGVSLLALHGGLSQVKRLSVYESFCRKSRVVMFATDLAARGLDFPGVNWVFQLDCPEDPETYIHRVGRTARLHRAGDSMLVLLPSEKAMLKRLEDHKIPLEEIMVNPSMLRNPTKKLEASLAHFPNLKETAQKAFVGYFRYLSVMKDKEVFQIDKLNMEAFARSLGLSVTPRVRFLERQKKKLESSIKTEKTPKSENEPFEDAEEDGVARSSAKKTAPLTTFNFGADESDDEADDVLTMKRQIRDLKDIPQIPEVPAEALEVGKKQKVITKASAAKRFLKKNIIPNTKVIFDEEGEIVPDEKSQRKSEVARQYEAETDVSGIDVQKAQELMREEDRFDKQRFRERVKAKHRELRLKAKAKAKEEKEAKKQGSADESDSEDSGPDLSWLPDPDKVYGDKKSDDSDQEGSDGEDASDGDEDEIHRPPKRKLAVKGQVESQSRKRARGEDFTPLDTGLSLHEDEELALKFLQSRN